MNTMTVAGITFDPANLAQLSVADLTTIYNAKAEKKITKFRDKPTAVKRVSAILVQDLRKEERNKRKSPMLKAGVIKVLVKTNPKKPNSKAAQRFDMYHDGMTVAEAYKKGLHAEDLRYDVARGFIAVEAPTATTTTA